MRLDPERFKPGADPTEGLSEAQCRRIAGLAMYHRAAVAAGRQDGSAVRTFDALARAIDAAREEAKT